MKVKALQTSKKQLCEVKNESCLDWFIKTYDFEYGNQADSDNVVIQQLSQDLFQIRKEGDFSSISCTHKSRGFYTRFIGIYKILLAIKGVIYENWNISVFGVSVLCIAYLECIGFHTIGYRTKYNMQYINNTFLAKASMTNFMNNLSSLGWLNQKAKCLYPKLKYAS